MDNTKKFSISLVVLLIGVFYFYQNNDTKIETKIDTKQQETKAVKVDKVEQKQTNQQKQVVQKKIENKIVNPVVYKNDSSNRGYNMELKVPEKWAHLDYSHLGNPPEVALIPEEYLPGDKLYKPEDERFWKDGQYYLTAESEKVFLSLYQDRETVKLILDEVEFPMDRTRSWKDTDLDGYFSDINRAIYIDEETGRKKLREGIIFDTSRLLFAMDFGFAQEDIDEQIKNGTTNRAQRLYSEDEYEKIKNFYSTYRYKINLNTGYNDTLHYYGSKKDYEDSLKEEEKQKQIEKEKDK